MRVQFKFYSMEVYQVQRGFCGGLL